MSGTSTNRGFIERKRSMRKRLGQQFKSVLIGMMLGVIITTLAFGQATLLPNAKQQYVDDSGNPVSAGHVDYFVPGQSTRKTVWQDAAETTPAPNPVLLDAAGRPQPTGQTYGSGSYRQRVVDQNGITIWDAVTASTSGSGGGGGGSTVGDGNIVGTILPWAGLVAPPNYVFAYGQEISRATYPLFFSTSTFSTSVVCTSGLNVLSGLGDTQSIKVGATVEATCIPPGTTVTSIAGSSVTVSAGATISTAVTAVFFPYGNGNGSTTTNVPDLRGRSIAGRDNMGGSVAGRLTSTFFAAPGLGATAGFQSNTLSLIHLPPYTPVGAITNGAITSTTPQLGGSAGTTQGNTPQSTVIGATAIVITSTQATSTFAGTPQGGSQTPFGVVQPSMELNYVIKVAPDASTVVASGVASLGDMTGIIACGTGLSCSSNTISNTVTVFNPLLNGVVPTITLEEFAGGTGISDNTAALTAAIAAVPTFLAPIKNGATIKLGMGIYNFTGAQAAINKNNVTLECAPGATILWFNPTGASTFLKWGDGLNELAGGGIRNCTLYSPDTTFTKVMVESSDMSNFTLENVQIFGAGGSNSLVTGGTGSVGWRTKGREFTHTIGINKIAADIPLRLSINPNSYLALDHFDMNGLFLIGGSSYPCVLADPGLYFSSTNFENQSWNACKGGLYFNDTAAVNNSEITTGGSNYVAGEIITIAGGTCSTAIKIKAITVSAGAILTTAVSEPGVCSVVPPNPMAQASTTGVGTGATFTANLAVSDLLKISGRAEQAPDTTAYSIYISPAAARFDNVNISNFQFAVDQKGIFLQKATTTIEDSKWTGALEAITADSSNVSLLLKNNTSFGVTTNIALTSCFVPGAETGMVVSSLALYANSGCGITIGNGLSLRGPFFANGASSGFATINTQAIAGTPTIVWPTGSGTVVTSASGCLALNAITGVLTSPTCLSGTPSALTKTDDTNVTLTLGGTPATALLQTTSLTLGWAGTLSVARGGTGIGSGVPGGIPYFSSTSAIASSAALSNSAIVVGGGAGNPPTTLGSLGTATTLLHGNAAGNPSFAAVSLTADVSGTLPTANGGTGNAGGAWGTYTPGTVCNTGSGTWVTNSAKFQTIGKSTLWQIDVTLSVLNTCLNSVFKFNLPSIPASGGGGGGAETATSGAALSCGFSGGSAVATCTIAGTVLVVNGRYVASGVYEGP